MLRKVIFSCIITCTAALAVFGQRNYYPGKIIDLNGDTTSVLISISDWSVTPENVRFKISESASSDLITPSNVRGFIIEDKITFISALVDIDVSSDKADRLSQGRNPIWKSESVFLQVLVNGKTNLYEYRNTNLTRFFFGNHEGSETDRIQQLIYKRYLNPDKKIIFNRQYRSQLWANFKCGTDQEIIKTVDYKRQDLIKFLTDYSECEGINATRFKSYKLGSK